MCVFAEWVSLIFVVLHGIVQKEAKISEPLQKSVLSFTHHQGNFEDPPTVSTIAALLN